MTQRYSLSCWNANKKIVPGQIKKIVVMMFNFVPYLEQKGSLQMLGSDKISNTA